MRVSWPADWLSYGRGGCVEHLDIVDGLPWQAYNGFIDGEEGFDGGGFSEIFTDTVVVSLGSSLRSCTRKCRRRSCHGDFIGRV